MLEFPSVPLTQARPPYVEICSNWWKCWNTRGVGIVGIVGTVGIYRVVCPFLMIWAGIIGIVEIPKCFAHPGTTAVIPGGVGTGGWDCRNC